MTKNILIFSIALALFSCKKEDTSTYVTISGKITNHLGNNGSIKSRGYSKDLKINKDGTFKDTLHLKSEGAMYQFTDGNEYAQLYLKNGDNINLTLDTKQFDETLKYTGTGAENNNYLVQKSLLSEKLFSGDLFDLDDKAFNSKATEIVSKFKEFLNNAKNIDANLIASENKELETMEKGLKEQYVNLKTEKERYAKFIGKPSPAFNNYENINGKTTSLKDLKGKYVYVDVWATWCGPCKAEIPSLKALEEEYRDKNIEFVSISVDNEKAKDAWKKMIAEKQMKGIQLYAGKDKVFTDGYGVNTIPRFILIDPKGNVVDANAPRPSSQDIKNILKGLKL